MSDNIREITQDEFEKEVHAKPFAIVDFYSTECPPCDAFAVKYHRAARLFGDDVAFFKIFRQGNRKLAEKYGVRSSPTVLFFKNGELSKTRLFGAIKNSELVRELTLLLPAGRGDELLGEREYEQTETDVLVLGGGPAGLTAGIYLAQAKLRVMIVDTALAGGYVSVTHEVSNYPGFAEPQQGFMLAHYMYEQAVKTGCEFRAAAEISSVDVRKKTVVLDDTETIRARFLVIASGSSPKKLGIPGETEYQGQGISYCATCDAKYYEGKDVVVIGGGNSALEESLFIARFARKVTIVHQFMEFTANRRAVEQILAHPTIETLLGHEPRRFDRRGDKLETEVEELSTGRRVMLSPHGVFIFAGFTPNTDGFGDELKRDDYGYLAADDAMHTNIPGVFTAGDVRSKKYRQITTAVADGTIAAIEITKDVQETPGTGSAPEAASELVASR